MKEAHTCSSEVEPAQKLADVSWKQASVGIGKCVDRPRELAETLLLEAR